MATSGIGEQSFKINLQILKSILIYPPDQESRFYTVKSYLIFLLSVPVVPILGVLYVLRAEDLDVKRAKYDAAFLVQTLCCTPKLFSILKNGRRIRKCINYFDLPVNELTNEEQTLVQDCINICWRSTKYFSITSVVVVICWGIEPMLGKKRRLPVDLWLPFDVNGNFMIFWCVYIYIVGAIFFCALVFGSVVPIPGGLLYHATVQVKLLKNKLQHLNENANEELEKQHVKDEFERLHLKNEIIYNKIRKCVSQHQAILDFVSEYDACFSVYLLSHFTFCALTISFLCLQLSQNSSIDMDFAYNISFFSNLLVEIFFYCYYGTTLTTETDTLTSTIYSSNWFEFDIRCKKALIIIVQRSQKPIILTVAKLFDLSLVTFTTILRRSYSLIALLKNFQ